MKLKSIILCSLAILSTPAFGANGFNTTTGSMPMGAEGTEYMWIVPGGFVGIGTPSPQATLDVAGEIRVGNSGYTCTGDNEGAQRYNSTKKKMEYCNGSSWRIIGGEFGGLYACAGSGTGFSELATTDWNETHGCSGSTCLTTNAQTGDCSCQTGYSPVKVAADTQVTSNSGAVDAPKTLSRTYLCVLQ